MDEDAFWQWAKTPREQGGAGLQSGQRVADTTIAALQREWLKQSQKWEIKESGGNYVRMNPQTGLVLQMTNEQGQVAPAPARSAGGMDPYAAYMNPAGVAGATVDTNSAAFSGVQPSPMPAAAPAGNAVMPVNVNPAAPAGQRTAGPAVPTGQTNAAPAVDPAFAAAASKVYKKEEDVIADARAGYLSKAQAQAILVNQFGLDP